MELALQFEETLYGITDSLEHTIETAILSTETVLIPL